MKKHLIKELAPEEANFSLYFEDDGITSASGDFLNNLFIVCNEGWGRVSGFNMDEYEGIKKQADGILNGFDDVENWEGGYNTYKEVIEDYSIKYSPPEMPRPERMGEKRQRRAGKHSGFFDNHNGEQVGMCRRLWIFSRGLCASCFLCRKIHGQNR